MTDDLSALPEDVREALFNVGKRCDAQTFDVLVTELMQRAMSDCNGGWRKIETAPRDGTPIFGCLDGDCYTGHGFLPVCVRWGTFHPNATGKATWRAAHGYKVERLTHWMPLPPPPKGED